VTRLGDSSAPFDYLKSDSVANLKNGIYVHFDEHSFVELVSSNPEASDFFFPNGGFSDRRFELISHFSDSREHKDAGPYLVPATELPPARRRGLEFLIAKALLALAIFQLHRLNTSLDSNLNMSFSKNSRMTGILLWLPRDQAALARPRWP
jgi:hypothetical protein